MTTDRRGERRRGGRATITAMPAKHSKPPADSPNGLLATIYKSNYPEAAPTPEEQLDAIRRLRSLLDEEEQQIVFGLRLRGQTWDYIAGLFGLKSRQAAQQRFAPAALLDKLNTAAGRETKP